MDSSPREFTFDFTLLRKKASVGVLPRHGQKCIKDNGQLVDQQIHAIKNFANIKHKTIITNIEQRKGLELFFTV